MKPDIVYRHADWCVLHKPAAYSVQDLSELYAASFPVFHPVHRLDKDTSGLWLIATCAKANSALSQAFEQRLVQKEYLAIGGSKCKKKQGSIVGDMQKSRRGQWQLLRTRQNPAITSFSSCRLREGQRLYLCQPQTGKTHQIRVAMKSNSVPVLGDSIYANATADEFDRLYLHAYRLAFVYDEQKFEFEVLPNTGELFRGESFLAALAAIDAN